MRVFHRRKFVMFLTRILRVFLRPSINEVGPFFRFYDPPTLQYKLCFFCTWNIFSSACKDLFETKLKKCAYLKPISSHFFANYMIVFHKTGVQKVNLRCLMGLNPNWFNSHDTKHKYLHFRFFHCKDL